MEQTRKLVPPRSTARYSPWAHARQLLFLVARSLQREAHLLGTIGYARDVCGNLTHAGAILLQAKVCKTLSCGQLQCEHSARKAREGAPTHLADELAHALVEADIVVLELLDDSVCLGGEPHGEWSGDRRGGRKGLRVFANRFGGGLGKGRVRRTEERVKIYYMREMEQLGVMEDKLDELRQGGSRVSSCMYSPSMHACTCTLPVKVTQYVPRHETDRGAGGKIVGAGQLFWGGVGLGHEMGELKRRAAGAGQDRAGLRPLKGRGPEQKQKPRGLKTGTGARLTY